MVVAVVGGGGGGGGGGRVENPYQHHPFPPPPIQNPTESSVVGWPWVDSWELFEKPWVDN